MRMPPPASSVLIRLLTQFLLRRIIKKIISLQENGIVAPRDLKLSMFL
jgi:hypothetical protein